MKLLLEEKNYPQGLIKRRHADVFEGMTERYVPSRGVVWREKQEPDSRIFSIGNLLCTPNMKTELWKTIHKLLFNILTEPPFAMEKGTKPFFFLHLRNFAEGRMNELQCRICELCILGNIRKDLNLIRNAYDIVERILELEATGPGNFVHNAPPTDKLYCTTHFH